MSAVNDNPDLELLTCYAVHALYQLERAALPHAVGAADLAEAIEMLDRDRAFCVRKMADQPQLAALLKKQTGDVLELTAARRSS